MSSNDQSRLVGIDKEGRSVAAADYVDNGKKVGSFFWLWIGQPYASGVWDATEILKKENGAQMLYHEDVPGLTPAGQAHWWGQPLWGYYNSDDKWVIRKQMEMLASAGVDFIVFDATNAVTYFNVYTRIMEAVEEMLDEGANPPLCAFYTHTHSIKTTLRLYDELYSKGLYSRAWYRVNGKPFIVAFTDPVADKIAEEITIRHKTDYAPQALPQEVLDFFTFRRPQWPTNDTVYPDGFPWIEWIYPQPIHTDMMSVTVASHPNVPMSFTRTRGLENWGRGWDPEKKRNVPENCEKGTFFQLQWDNALAAKDKLDTVFVGGWNEWIAYKSIYDNEYMLCDAADMELSRDCEPMKGGYEDNFYLQLIRNVRAFKNSGVKKELKGAKLNPASEGWDNAVAYDKIGKKPAVRDALGCCRGVHYTADAARNTLNTIKVANDEQNLYVRIECADEIQPYNGCEGYLTLYIGKGEPHLGGFYGYDLAVTFTGNDKAQLNIIDKQGARKAVCPVDIRIIGNAVEYTIPLDKLEADSIYFKATDSVIINDIMDTYTQGSAMPMGRLSYQYNIEK